MFRLIKRYNVQCIVLLLLVFTLSIWHKLRQGGPSTDVQVIQYIRENRNEKNAFLVPDSSVLNKMDEVDLYRVYLRYTSSRQILCRNIMRFGPVNDENGKDVCIDDGYALRNSLCLVYSFGSNLRFDFEEAVIQTAGCEVHTFDPSIPITDANRGKIPKGVNYHLIGIDGREFVNKRGWTMRTLPSVLKELHHGETVIDILKIDAEGGEWSGFQNKSDFDALQNVKQLLIEFHFGKTRQNKLWGGVPLVKQLNVLRMLHEIGFKICSSSPIRHLATDIHTDYGKYIPALNEMTLINPKWIERDI